MAIAQIYASTVSPMTSTWVNINNIIGSDASEASCTSTVAVNSIDQLRLGFDVSAIPAGSSITSLILTVVGRCNAATSRAFFSAEAEDAYGTTYTTNGSALDFTTTADARFVSLNNVSAVSPWLGQSNLRFNLGFVSRINASRILYIQYAYLTLNYELAAGGGKTLFHSENF